MIQLRIAVTGASGLLGTALVQVLSKKFVVLPLGRRDLEITDPGQVQTVLKRLVPDVIIHAAAIADPDICEKSPDLAYSVNVEGTRLLVEGSRQFATTFVFISTDAVFDGAKSRSYHETDMRSPISVYGKSKALAEDLVSGVSGSFICRPSVLFGPGPMNFVSRCLSALKSGQTFVAAVDQIGTATTLSMRLPS